MPGVGLEAAVRSHILLRNVVLNILGQLLPLAVTVATIPAVIRGLGVERFGILALAGILAGYLQIFDLGLSRAVTKAVSEALGRDESLRVTRIAHTAFMAEGFLGVAAGLVLAAAASVLVESILHIPDDLRNETLRSLRILSLSLPPLLVASSLRAVLEAAQRFDLVNAVSAPVAIVGAMIPLLGIHLGLDLAGIVALQVLLSAIVLVIYAALVISTFPSLRGFPGFAWSEFSDLMAFGGWITLANAVGPFLLYTDRFLIGALLTVADVAYYSAPFQVISRLWVIPTGLAMTLFPAFAMYRSRPHRDLHELYFRSIKYLLLQAGPVILVLVVFAGDILRIWLGVEFARNGELAFQILLLGAFVGLLAPVPGVLLQSIGRPDIISKLYVLYLPFNMVIAWVMIRHLGLVGAALSFALRTALDALLLFVISMRTLRLSWSALHEHRLWRAIGLAIGSGILLWLLSRTPSPAARMGLAATWTIGLSIAAWRYALDSVDRRTIVTAFGKTRL